MKKLLTILTAAFLLMGVFTGCNNADAQPGTPDTPPIEQNETEPAQQHFTKNGISFTLPEDFIDYTDSPIGQDYTFLYANNYIGVLGIQDNKEALPETVTDLASYAAYQAEAIGVEAVQKDGVWTLTYQDPTQNETQSYLCVFYEWENSYWTVKSYCTEDMYEANQEAMWGYVTAATFDETEKGIL